MPPSLIIIDECQELTPVGYARLLEALNGYRTIFGDSIATVNKQFHDYTLTIKIDDTFVCKNHHWRRTKSRKLVCACGAEYDKVNMR